MIFTWLAIVILGMLVLASIFDLKYKAVPSAILTTGIFTALLVNPTNLYFGVVCLVFGILIRDLIDDVTGLDFGVADIKIFVIFGLLLTNFEALFLMIIIFLVFQFVYTVVWRWRVSQEAEMPFIPCLLAVYITLMLLGCVA